VTRDEMSDILKTTGAVILVFIAGLIAGIAFFYLESLEVSTVIVTPRP